MKPVKVTIVILSLLCLFACEPEQPPDPLTGIEVFETGMYVDIPAGRLYLPGAWQAKDSGKWPVTVILHGLR